MPNRRLALRRESVTELAPDELARLAGASAGTCRTCILDCVTPTLVGGPTLDAVDCLSDLVCR